MSDESLRKRDDSIESWKLFLLFLVMGAFLQICFNASGYNYIVTVPLLYLIAINFKRTRELKIKNLIELRLGEYRELVSHMDKMAIRILKKQLIDIVNSQNPPAIGGGLLLQDANPISDQFTWTEKSVIQYVEFVNALKQFPDEIKKELKETICNNIITYRRNFKKFDRNNLQIENKEKRLEDMRKKIDNIDL